MIRALVTSLETLADAGDPPPDGIPLARAFEDAWREARRSPGLEWTQHQHERLGEADNSLSHRTAT